MTQTESKNVDSILTEVSSLLSQIEKHQRLLTILFTDIVGSTSYFERHGDVRGMLLLQRIERLLRPLVKEQEGNVVKTIGDSLMAYFSNPVKAVRCAMAMQQAVERYNRRSTREEPVQIRVAINLGVAILRGADVFGDVVNVCSRIEEEAKPGQIWVSPSVVEAVQREADIRCHLVGAVALRGKAKEMDLYVVEAGGGSSPAARSSPPPSNDQLALAAGASVRSSGQLRTLIAQAAGGRVSDAGLSGPPASFSLAEVLPEGKPGRRFTLSKGVTIAGRADADLDLEDPWVAPQHAVFTVLGGALYVDDVSSGAGVFLQLRAPHRLAEGDLVALGRLRFRFHIAPDGPDGARAELIRERPDKAPALFLQRGETTVGRQQGTLQFPDDPYLSRLHARFLFLGTQCLLEDLGSSNGTYVAVQERRRLAEGDTLLLGEKVLRVIRDQ